MKAVITSNPYRDKDLQHAVQARDVLLSAGAQVCICLAFDVDPAVKIPEHISVGNLEKELQDADILICFGGDGTLLHSSKYALSRGIPVLGVNIGTLGFMADLEASEISRIAALVEGNYQVQKRMMLDVRVARDGRIIYEDIALNDASVTKGAVSRVIQLDIKSSGANALSFSGDGLILATPTGSTGYSLSAGGPVVEPSSAAIIVTPVCAHSMTARPLVLSENAVVETTVGRTGKRNAFLSVDGGKAFRLNAGDTITVSKSEQYTKLVCISNRNFFDILRSKLK